MASTAKSTGNRAAKTNQASRPRGKKEKQATRKGCRVGIGNTEPSCDPTQGRRLRDLSSSQETTKTRRCRPASAKTSSIVEVCRGSRSSPISTRSTSTQTQAQLSLPSGLLSAPADVQQEFLLSLPETLQIQLMAILKGPEDRWRPLPGPQTMAYQSQADILLYGGAAGGGKTDLLLGLARNEHRRAIIFRRVSPSLAAIIERSREIYNPGRASNSEDSFNEQLHRWRFEDGRQIRFRSIQYDDNSKDYQGQPHDLYGFDEITEFTEYQFRYVTGWNRTTVRGQRCRTVCTGNPPTTPEGEWVIPFWGPWLDPNHPNPAKPGELRWCTTVGGKDVWVPDSRPFVVVGDQRVYDFDPKEFKPSDIITPRSRTFIPARVEDNPYQVEAGYVAVLQALPEPLRSKMLLGDFRAGREDSAYQVIPSEWVRLAQERWRSRPRPTTPMSALGVDVARGGRDRSVFTPRYDNWVGEQITEPGKSTPDGPEVAAMALRERRDDCPVQIDIIGVGTSPFDALHRGYVDKDGTAIAGIGEKAIAMNGSEASSARDKSGKLGFVNKRAEWWWKAREALDPASGQDVALPPDPELRADLCAPTYKNTVRGIQVEAKEDLIKRLHRSPDKGDSCIYSLAIPDSGDEIIVC